MLDLKKAFELVQRGLLAQAAADAGYPLDVLAWGLSMYSWVRRVVFRKAVSDPMWGNCGIVAGSATATMELWVHLAAPIGRLVRQMPRIRLCIHVDDITGTAMDDDDEEEVVEQVVDFFVAARDEIEVDRKMKVAPDKDVIVATSQRLADAIAARLGISEAGLVCKKLGADYSLGAFEDPEPAALHACRNPLGPPRPRAKRCRDAAAAGRRRRAGLLRRGSEKARRAAAQRAAATATPTARIQKAKRRMRRFPALRAGGRNI